LEFINLKKQYQLLESEILDRIQNVLNHGQYVMGPEVFELETILADYVQTKHCISCSSGTDALLMSLMALDIKPGDAVFTTPFTFFATAEVIQFLGATPVFVDIEENTFNICSEKLKNEILKIIKIGQLNPKAIIPVDLFGLPANYNEIQKIADKFNLKVIEDSAQGLGGKINKKMAGSLGDIGTTSFFPAKPLGCYGDGGAIFTDNDEIADKLKSIRVHGQGVNKYENIRIGINGRLDTIQATILISKMKLFDNEILDRNKIANKYSELLNDSIKLQFIPDGYRSAWAQYSILLNSSNQREIVQQKLSKNKIPSAIYYLKPLHLQKAFENLNYNKGDFVTSEDISQRILSLPMHPYLLNEEIEKITKIINTCI
jgi:UDP-2-acetamido-2-deoxy-ribo-hexuluronate aminotransferase